MLAIRTAGGALLMSAVPMPSMMEEVHQRASQDEQKRQGSQQVCPMFRPQEKGGNCQEAGQRPFPAGVVLLALAMCVRGVVHGCLAFILLIQY
jgi:hypothetical protein